MSFNRKVTAYLSKIFNYLFIYSYFVNTFFKIILKHAASQNNPKIVSIRLN